MEIKIKILALFILVSGFAFSQNAGFKSNAISANFSIAEMEAYQESADNKIEDFYSYLNLLSDKSISKKTKTEIKESILLLFQNNQTTVLNFTSETHQPLSLFAFLNMVENQEIHFKVLHLSSKKPDTYSDFWISEYALEIIQNKTKTTKSVLQKVYFSPKNKKFGSISKRVWEIKLGEIE